MAKTAWTWMIYVATHNNVAGWGEKSIENIKAADLGDDVQVVIQQTTPTGTTRMQIKNGETESTDMGEDVDSGDAGTLVDFAKWGKEVAPAKRYALVLWSHGSGWEPSEIQGIKLERSVSQPFTVEEYTERGADSSRWHVFFAPSMAEIVGQDDEFERDIAFDNGTGHSLDTVELGKALDDIKTELGRPVDLLGMNACLMATVEVVYQVRNAARVYVASEELMPAESWPYKEILTQLGKKPRMRTKSLGKLIVNEYTDFFSDDSFDLTERGIDGSTLTAVNVDGVEDLAEAVKKLAKQLSEEMDSQFGVIWNAQRATVQFQNNHQSYHLYDLGMFCTHLTNDAQVSDTVKAAAEGVIAILSDDDFILAEAHTSEKDDGIMGLTTYLMQPVGGNEISQFYGQTAYAQDVGWEDFLWDYFDAAADAD